MRRHHGTRRKFVPLETTLELPTSRVETLVDGVFAIAMTLLVLDLKVPTLVTTSPDVELAAQLVDLGPRLLAYAGTFIVLGVFWFGHHVQSAMIRRADRIFVWINLLFMLFVAFIPFTAALLGRYPEQRLAVIIYGVNIILVGSCLTLQWRYATGKRRLVDADMPERLVRFGTVRFALGPVVFLVAIALSFVSTRLSLALFVGVPLLFLLPEHIDRAWSPKPDLT
jgi:uncharacterized membrane protein